MKVTQISLKGIDLIQQFEGLRLKPYLCQAGVPTIGIGTTVYPDGKKVSLKDKEITEIQAIEFLKHDLTFFCSQVDSFTTDLVSQFQFDALTSFAYNLGTGALKGSTLLKKVNANPNDPTIHNEFLKWVMADGKRSQGLLNRRIAESELYFTK